MSVVVPFSSFLCLLQQCQENCSSLLVVSSVYCNSARKIGRDTHVLYVTMICFQENWSRMDIIADPLILTSGNVSIVFISLFFWQILAVTSLSFGHITMLWATFPFLLIIWLYTVSFIENLLFRQYATVIYALLFFHISIFIHHLFGYHFFKLLNWYPPLWLLFELFNRLCCNEGTNSRFQHVFHYFLPLPVISETANIPRYASLTVDRISRLAIFGFNELC